MPTNEYLRFEERPSASGKTLIVTVHSVHHGDLLGLIKWHGPWRQYCFLPSAHTVWNRGCMQTVQDKITEMMAERKSA